MSWTAIPASQDLMVRAICILARRGRQLREARRRREQRRITRLTIPGESERKEAVDE